MTANQVNFCDEYSDQVPVHPNRSKEQPWVKHETTGTQILKNEVITPQSRQDVRKGQNTAPKPKVNSNVLTEEDEGELMDYLVSAQFAIF